MQYIPLSPLTSRATSYNEATFHPRSKSQTHLTESYPSRWQPEGDVTPVKENDTRIHSQKAIQLHSLPPSTTSLETSAETSLVSPSLDYVESPVRSNTKTHGSGLSSPWFSNAVHRVERRTDEDAMQQIDYLYT